jgi:hypothetical protein
MTRQTLLVELPRHYTFAGGYFLFSLTCDDLLMLALTLLHLILQNLSLSRFSNLLECSGKDCEYVPCPFIILTFFSFLESYTNGQSNLEPLVLFFIFMGFFSSCQKICFYPYFMFPSSRFLLLFCFVLFFFFLFIKLKV